MDLKMRKFCSTVIIIINLLCIAYLPSARANESLTLFPTEQTAQPHCRNDEIVWLNTPTGIWHVQGAHWYGNTDHGAYVCKQEAAAAGNRASRNG